MYVSFCIRFSFSGVNSWEEYLKNNYLSNETQNLGQLINEFRWCSVSSWCLDNQITCHWTLTGCTVQRMKPTHYIRRNKRIRCQTRQLMVDLWMLMDGLFLPRFEQRVKAVPPLPLLPVHTPVLITDHQFLFLFTADQLLTILPSRWSYCVLMLFRHVRKLWHFFSQNMRTMALRNMRQKYEVIGCDCIFTLIWHGTFFGGMW